MNPNKQSYGIKFVEKYKKYLNTLNTEEKLMNNMNYRTSKLLNNLDQEIIDIINTTIWYVKWNVRRILHSIKKVIKRTKMI